MKTSLFILFLCTLGIKQAPIDKLIGKWKLEKVVNADLTIYPKVVSFYLTISKEEISFNPDCINQCWVRINSVSDSTIILDTNSRCTGAFCASPKEAISNSINYGGSYTLHDSILIITNKKDNHYLKRQP
jgi:hypothetical protein